MNERGSRSAICSRSALSPLSVRLSSCQALQLYGNCRTLLSRQSIASTRLCSRRSRTPLRNSRNGSAGSIRCSISRTSGAAPPPPGCGPTVYGSGGSCSSCSCSCRSKIRNRAYSCRNRARDESVPPYCSSSHAHRSYCRWSKLALASAYTSASASSCSALAAATELLDRRFGVRALKRTRARGDSAPTAGESGSCDAAAACESPSPVCSQRLPQGAAACADDDPARESPLHDGELMPRAGVECVGNTPPAASLAMGVLAAGIRSRRLGIQHTSSSAQRAADVSPRSDSCAAASRSAACARAGAMSSSPSSVVKRDMHQALVGAR